MKKILTIIALTFSMNIMSQEIYIPNAFTPNGDGINDIWKPVFSNTLNVNQYDLQIFDMNGTLVFWTNKPTDGWDGLPFDSTYAYKISMRWEGRSKSFSKNGTITIINF